MMKNNQEEVVSTAEFPHPNGLAPHLMCGPGSVADIVLLPGDPGRVQRFTTLCEDFHILASNREFTIGTGTYQGVPVSVCSTGIGGPSTEIAVTELIELGAKALIRIGGAGVLRKEISCGDMVITTGAMRQGGSSCFYAPPAYPAVASYQVVDALVRACEKNDARYWTGISASVGSFFAGQGRRALGKDFTAGRLEEYKKLNIVSMEMEAETIFTLSELYGVFSGSICAVHANRITDVWMTDFEEPQQRMCKIALDACVLLKPRIETEFH
jgi:uridine phosphorylase